MSRLQIDSRNAFEVGIENTNWNSFSPKNVGKVELDDNHSFLNFEIERLFTDDDDELATFKIEMVFGEVEIALFTDNGSTSEGKLLSNEFDISIISASCEEMIEYESMCLIIILISTRKC